MHWFDGNSAGLGAVACKAALMYITALALLRVGERRTLAQWTIMDFAIAVAMGAIIGRTALAEQSYLAGAVALLTLMAVHRVASVIRFNAFAGKLFDHRIRVLVADGELRRSELRRCALTDNDLFTQLRQRNVFDLADVQYVLYETKGSVTVVPKQSVAAGDPPLVHRALEGAAGFDPPGPDRVREHR
jgi:uncharacterized membrane protein YcaP (DUF421 family)